MPQGRYESAVVELAPNKIWVTGGVGTTSFQQSTIIYENGEWSYGADLPEGLEEHCMAKIDENTVILSGGENSPSYAENVYLFDISTETWTEIDSMPGGSRYGHSCGIAE